MVDGENVEDSVFVDTLNLSKWKNYYYDYYFTIVDTSLTNPPPYEPTLKAAEIMSQNNEIPFIMLISSINDFNLAALGDSTVYLDTTLNQYIINHSSTTTIYSENNIFISVPYQTEYTGNNFNFYWSQDFIQNLYEEIDAVLIDFDDGYNFRNLNEDSIVTIEYLTPGIKNITTKIEFKNGHILYSYSYINVNCKDITYLPLTPPPSPVDKMDIEKHYDILNSSWDKKIKYDQITTQIHYASHPRGGCCIRREVKKIEPKVEGYVYYGCGNNIFDKPFVIIEGFDPGNKLNPWSSLEKYNGWSFEENSCLNYDERPGMIEMLEKNTKVDPEDVNERGFFSRLIKEGYDVVIINQVDGGLPVREAGEYFAKFIKELNKEKQGNEPTIVMGVSMGGLIARIGIKELENDNYDHSVSHYISVDSPHRGAYINAATQLFLQFSNKHDKIKESIGSKVERLSSPAAKDMLIHYFSGSKNQYNSGGNLKDWTHDKTGDNKGFWVTYDTEESLDGIITNERKAFQDYLDNLGFPEETINITVSNGSFVNQNQNINVNEPLLNADASKVRMLSIRVEGWQWALVLAGLKKILGTFLALLLIDDHIDNEIHSNDLSYHLHVLTTVNSDFNLFPKYGESKTVVKTHYGMPIMSYDYDFQFDIQNNDPRVDFHLDNMAGGNVAVVKEVANEYYTWKECHVNEGVNIYNHQNVQTFIPTASSIDLRKPDGTVEHPYQYFNSNIKDLLNNGSAVSSFDYVYGIDVNTDHAMASQDWGNHLNSNEVSSRKNLLLSMLDDLASDRLTNIFFQNISIDDKQDFQTPYVIYSGRNIASSTSLIASKEGDVNFTSNSEIAMEAGQKIQFKQGTFINDGAKLHAKIKDFPEPYCFVNYKLASPDFHKETNNLKNKIEIFPNPAKNIVQLSLNGIENFNKIYIGLPPKK